MDCEFQCFDDSQKYLLNHQEYFHAPAAMKFRVATLQLQPCLSQNKSEEYSSSRIETLVLRGIICVSLRDMDIMLGGSTNVIGDFSLRFIVYPKDRR